MSSELDPKFYTKRLLHLAKEEMNRSRCKKCGNDKDRKVVDLYEFGDPYIPSSVLIFCPKCRYGQPFAVRPYEDAKRWAEYLMRGEESLKGYTGKLTDKILDLSILGKGKVPTGPLPTDDKVIKDEENKIIADKKTVEAKDKKKV